MIMNIIAVLSSVVVCVVGGGGGVGGTAGGRSHSEGEGRACGTEPRPAPEGGVRSAARCRFEM